MAQPFPDPVQPAVPDRPWRRSTGRDSRHNEGGSAPAATSLLFAHIALTATPKLA